MWAHAETFDGAAGRTPSEGGAAAVQESTLARWHDYALASITPQFSWALPLTAFEPRVLDNYATAVVARAPLFNAQQAAAARIEVSVATGNVADTPSVAPSQVAHLVGAPQPGLQRTIVAPSLARGWGDSGSIRVTGVLAYQRFASWGLGTAPTDGFTALPPWLHDSSYGVGARVDFSNRLTDNLRWTFGYQSRVGMGVFANYRGVFADSGDFDIPASATAGLGYALTPNLDVDLGVQRVMYGAITPFTSPSLPTRFLALLGDGASPVFAWRDLTVYSVGWTLHDQRVGNLQLRYTTRQQPMPTSKLLERALAPATANDVVSLGWTRPFGTRANLSVSASYATSPYYLMMPTYLSRNDGTAGQFEFDALWSLRF
ncbi:MAG TPA: hypothetical protein VGC30_16190 [Dokdonella sp.]